MKKIAILGLGHIGQYISQTLQSNTNFSVTGYDLTTGHDLTDQTILNTIINGKDGVLACTPYFLNTQIAEICNNFGVDYFDLTESVEVTSYVKTLTNARFVTQCGLAPGMVSIIANNLASQFQDVENIKIRVGALPRDPKNHMGYYRTWNTEGLINEYIHPCKALVNGKIAELEPLSDSETVIISGQSLEASSTSGGIGSLAETYHKKAKNVNYKTLRYPGHWQHMRFLKDDLGLAENFDTYVKIFNAHCPKTVTDRVYILITVTGNIDGVYCVRQYSKIIECLSDVTAIQLSTSGGVMAVLDAWSKGGIDHLNGWVKQEDLDYDLVWNSKYSFCYH